MVPLRLVTADNLQCHDPNLHKGYYSTPRWITAAPDISSNGKTVIGGILAHLWRDQRESAISTSKLSEATGLESWTVRRAYDELIAHRLIDRRPGEPGGPWITRILFDPLAKTPTQICAPPCADLHTPLRIGEQGTIPYKFEQKTFTFTSTEDRSKISSFQASENCSESEQPRYQPGAMMAHMLRVKAGMDEAASWAIVESQRVDIAGPENEPAAGQSAKINPRPAETSTGDADVRAKTLNGAEGDRTLNLRIANDGPREPSHSDATTDHAASDLADGDEAKRRVCNAALQLDRQDDPNYIPEFSQVQPRNPHLGDQ
jgi:hypothetical protein